MHKNVKDLLADHPMLADKMLFDSSREAILTGKVLSIGATEFKRHIEAVAEGWLEATLLYQVLVKAPENSHLSRIERSVPADDCVVLSIEDAFEHVTTTFVERTCQDHVQGGIQMDPLSIEKDNKCQVDAVVRTFPGDPLRDEKEGIAGGDQLKTKANVHDSTSFQNSTQETSFGTAVAFAMFNRVLRTNCPVRENDIFDLVSNPIEG